MIYFLDLVAEWSQEEKQQAETLTVPLETYQRGCVRDVEEGLEVSGGPWMPSKELKCY